MKRLKTIQLILLILLVAGINLKTTGQTTDKFIRVGDTTINLNDVDLEKGMVINKDVLSSKDNETVMVGKEVFRNFNNLNYLVVEDSSVFSGYVGTYKTTFSYYKSDGTLLFQKYFDNLNVSRVFILKEGNKVILELGSEAEIKFIIFDDNGNALKEIDNKEVYIYSDSQNKSVVLQPDGKEDELQIVNANTDQINVLKFPDRVWLKNFSPDGAYFTVRCQDSIKVYTQYGEYLWGIKYDNQNVYVFSNGRRYYIFHPYPKGTVEVKEAISNELLYKVTGVFYKSNKYPVYKCGVVNNSDIIWVSNYIGKIQVFNFIDEYGKIINDFTLPAKIATRNIYFIEENGKYCGIKR